MRAIIVLLAGLGLAASVLADEELAQLKVGDTVYHKVTVTRVSGGQIFSSPAKAWEMRS